MAVELDHAMEAFLADCTSENEKFSRLCPNIVLHNLDYTEVPAYGYVYSMVLAVTSRVFVGLPLAHEKAWLDTVSAYLAEVVAIGNALRPWPRALRPLLRPFLAPRHRMDTIIKNALKILTPAIKQRQSFTNGQDDLLGFLVETSEVVDPKAIILKLLVLTSAAVSSILITMNGK